MLIQQLPIKEDKSENETVMKCLCMVYGSASQIVSTCFFFRHQWVFFNQHTLHVLSLDQPFLSPFSLGHIDGDKKVLPRDGTHNACWLSQTLLDYFAYQIINDKRQSSLQMHIENLTRMKESESCRIVDSFGFFGALNRKQRYSYPCSPKKQSVVVNFLRQKNYSSNCLKHLIAVSAIEIDAFFSSIGELVARSDYLAHVLPSSFLDKFQMQNFCCFL